MSAIEMLNPEACECHSPQEQRNFDDQKGKKDKYYDTHARVFDLIAKFEGQTPVIDVERALYFTQSMQATEGQPLVLR